MDWGSFAGGVGSGIEQGQRIRAQQQAQADAAKLQADAARLQKARTDYGATLLTGAQQPDPSTDPSAGPQPGGVPTQGPPLGGPGFASLQGGGPSLMPLPGATPIPPGVSPGGVPPLGGAPQLGQMPPQGPQGAPLGMGAPQPSQGAPLGMGALQPSQGPPPTQTGSPPPTGPGATASLSGTADPSQNKDPMAAAMDNSKKTIQSIARSIYMTDPKRKWDPLELLDAVDQAVKTMNGLNPMEKMLASAQIEGQKAQTQFILQNMRDQTSSGNTQTRVAATERGQDLTHEDRQSSISSRLQGVFAEIAGRSANVAAQQAGATQRTGMQQAGATQREGMREASGMSDIKLEKALEGTAAGKAYANTASAINEIHNLASAPDIANNATAQTGLLNRYLFMTTGSTRPPLSELKKIMDAKDAQDIYDTLTKAPGSRPLLGQDQIDKIVSAADEVAVGAKDAAMQNPAVRGAIDKINSGGSKPPKVDYVWDGKKLVGAGAPKPAGQ